MSRQNQRISNTPLSLKSTTQVDHTKTAWRCFTARQSRNKRHSPFYTRAILLFSPAVFVISTLTTSTAWGVSSQETKLVAMVIDAIKRNNSLIQSAQLTLQETRSDAGVEEPEVQTFPQPNGGEVQIIRSPKVEWETRVVLRGTDLRIDRTTVSGSDHLQPKETLVLTKGVWSQYFPDGSVAWIRRHDQMPRTFPVDPREAASDGAHRGVIDALQEDHLVSANTISTTDGDPVVRIKMKNADDISMEYEFSARDTFLPSRVETRWPDGSLLQVVEIKYRDVLGGKAKFFKQGTRLFFPKGYTRTASQTGWKQKLSSEVVGDIVLNQSVDEDAFAVEFAPGTRVNDNIRLANYVVTPPLAVERNPMWPYTLTVVIVLLILAVVRRIKLSQEAH